MTVPAGAETNPVIRQPALCASHSWALISLGRIRLHSLCVGDGEKGTWQEQQWQHVSVTFFFCSDDVSDGDHLRAFVHTMKKKSCHGFVILETELF